VFSDRAPPPDIPANHVLKSPPGARMANVDATAAVPTSAPASATGAANVPKLTGVDPALEQKRKQAEAAEAAKQKADEQQVAAAKADNCKRAQQDKGEMVVMDDAQRQAESKRLAEIIARDCSPAH
jgi:hypothetical protein